MNRFPGLYLLFILMFIIPLNGLSQVSVPAGGGTASGAGGSMGFTVGQALYSQASGSGGVVISGIQNSFERTIINSVMDIDYGYSLVAYPNPATDAVRIKSDVADTGDLSYKLLDTRGTVLADVPGGSNGEISLSRYAAGTYIINVYRNGELVKIIKIVKK